MAQDYTRSISIELVRILDSIRSICLKSLRRNICDVEVFDGVLSQYFSGLKSLDILIQPSFESDSFQDFRCTSQSKLYKML